MKINININEYLILKEGWPIFELYDKNYKFLNIIELIPDGKIGILNSNIFFKWCILGNHLCILNIENRISMIGNIIDKETYTFKLLEISSINNYFYLKHIIS